MASMCQHAMQKISEMIAGMDYEERSALPCIGAERADLVVAGCAILEAIIEIWPASNLGVADRGIREGILRSLMARGRHGRCEAACKTAQGPQDLARRAGSSGSSTIPMSSAPRREGYRSRAAYKLLELDERFGFLKGVQVGGRPRHRAGRLEPGRAAQGADRRTSSASTCCRPTRSTASRSCRWISWTSRARTADGGTRRAAPTSSCRTWRRIPSAIRRPIISARWRWSRRGWSLRARCCARRSVRREGAGRRRRPAPGRRTQAQLRDA